MDTAESKRIVLRFIDDLSAGNIDAVMAAFADDVTWWLPGTLPVSGTFAGRDAILNDFLAKAIPYFAPGTMSIQVRSAIAEGGMVAVEWISRAQTAKGRTYENYYHMHFEVEGGKINIVREYVDSLYAHDVLFT